jgi:NADPH-dependent curcumin reductase CurA
MTKSKLNFAEVIDTKSDKFEAGDFLVGILPWQEYAVIDTKKVEKIIPDENIIEGFEKLPTAFLGLFQGENIGKQLVRV